MSRTFAGLAIVLCTSLAAADSEAKKGFETISFPSEDGVVIEADLYLGHPKTAPIIVLFHQAGWSRGEYREIAPKLVALGFNALAIDARSGRAINKVKNETARRARAQKKGTNYVDALPDLRAALRHARAKYTTSKVIAWGSSYSSALVLYLAGAEPALADATLSFAPGEYFRKYGKSGTWIRDAARSITKPVFITAARNEHRKWKAIFAAIPAKTKRGFVPTTRGNHGSKALWAKYRDSDAYWKEVRSFLGGLR